MKSKKQASLNEVKPEIIIHDSPESLGMAVAQILRENALKNQREGTPFNIALCGGNTPQIAFRLFAEAEFRQSVPWEIVHLFWGDERCVPSDHDESNYRMARDTFIDSVPIPKSNIHRIRGEDDPTVEAKRYEEEIRSALPSKNGEAPQFDWVLLGLGTDGHTASLFPGGDLVVEGQEICAVATHPQSGQKRITLTLLALNNAKLVSFVSTGKEKAMVVSQILNGSPGCEHYPAGRVNPSPGKLQWILDKDSASELNHKT